MCVKGAGSRDVNRLLSNDNFPVFLIVHITAIFNYCSHNKSVILKMDA